MTLKVRMVPHVNSLNSESGIATLIRKYFEHLPGHGIDLVPDKAESYDLLAIHAGMATDAPAGVPLVSMLHGLYWTADLPSMPWQHKANRDVIRSIRAAAEVTVPSEWVAETLRHDMHLDPVVVPHGIDWQEWTPRPGQGNYILWNKNRVGDVCSPETMGALARARPDRLFLTTYAPVKPTPNIKATGLVPHAEMRRMVEGCAIYLCTTKETFGIGILEAMAAAKPVLGYREGNLPALVEHGLNGYLAEPGDFEDLLRGLDYCMTHAATLGLHGRGLVKQWDWESALGLLAGTFEQTLDRFHQPVTVDVVIPVYNKVATLERAVRSVLAQTRLPAHIVLVDNNSSDGSLALAHELAALDPRIVVVQETKQGVAHARNAGLATSRAKYICFLDADDEIRPAFLEVCMQALEQDPSLGLAYTRLLAVNEQGQEAVSAWPDEYNFDLFLVGKNQVPTCCVIRAEPLRRLGGYRQRFAPQGAGSEDAELWLRLGGAGYGGKLASKEPLFVYHLGGAVSGNPSYSEPDWRAGKPWVKDKQHPFSSLATPANGQAHPVRQYDVPRVSVIIPVVPAHLPTLIDALDSLEAQTLRQWEAIVVWDGPVGHLDEWAALHKAYPFMRLVSTDSPFSGAGAARNVGAKLARAPYLLFLDADDWLAPHALEALLAAQIGPGAVTYGDYLGYAFLNDAERARLEQARRMMQDNGPDKPSIVRYYAAEYDCEDAQRQPAVGGPLYLWCNVSSLTPTVWHHEIGGFDETMDSWEDWDYWLRLARAGKCFIRVPEPLLNYRFYSGNRRAQANPDESGDAGRLLSGKLLDYMREKYKEKPAMPCGGCKGGRQRPLPASQPVPQSLNMGGNKQMSADGLVRVELVDGNVGDHLIAFGGTNYGYRKHKDIFLMSRAHASLDRRVRVLEEDTPPVAERPLPPPPPPVKEGAETIDEERTGLRKEGRSEKGETPPPPEPLRPQVYDFTQIKGIGPKRAERLVEIGVRTLDGFLALGADGLMREFNLTPKQAKGLVEDAKGLKETA